MRTLCFVLLNCFLGASAIAADPSGIDVGTKVPEIILNDQNGKKVQLSQLLESKPVALVFHRSASW